MAKMGTEEGPNETQSEEGRERRHDGQDDEHRER
jgi:hypothetical protein